jgi:type I restriction enzyme S subunit
MSNLAETSIPWIGQIPTDWDIKPLFSIATENKTKNKDRNENVLSLSYGRIIRRDLSKNFGLLPENFDGYQVVETGYIIIRSTDLQNDKKSLRVGLVKENGVITSAYIGLSPSNTIHPEYLFYYLNMCDLKKVFYSLGGGLRQSLRFEEFKRFPVIVPPIEEQKLISQYLDKKTSQIDSLVETIQKKIDLLKEQRTSLINHYVTKGLDPNVEMKDSGVEWIGEIPKHWEVSRIKHIHQQKIDSFIDGDWIESPYITDHGIRYITTGNIGEGVFKFQGNSFISQNTFDELKCSEVFPGNLVISRLSPPVGRSCIIPDLGHRIVTSVDNVIVRLKNDLSIYYYNYLFNSARSFENTSTLSRGTTLTRISRTMLGNIETLIPPVDEQIEIVSYLDQRLNPLEKLEENEHNRITLLKEYRQSLISSVVTGKIRVTEDMI